MADIISRRQRIYQSELSHSMLSQNSLHDEWQTVTSMHSKHNMYFDYFVVVRIVDESYYLDWIRLKIIIMNTTMKHYVVDSLSSLPCIHHHRRHHHHRFDSPIMYDSPYFQQSTLYEKTEEYDFHHHHHPSDAACCGMFVVIDDVDDVDDIVDVASTSLSSCLRRLPVCVAFEVVVTITSFVSSQIVLCIQTQHTYRMNNNSSSTRVSKAIKSCDKPALSFCG
jgi:hypothetical protein